MVRTALSRPNKIDYYVSEAQSFYCEDFEKINESLIKIG